MDLEFRVRSRQHKKMLITQWVGHHDSFFSAEANSFSAEKYRYFGSIVYDIRFDYRAFRLVEGEQPPVTLPQECFVGKCARRFVYYIFGWTMYILSLANARYGISVGVNPKTNVGLGVPRAGTSNQKAMRNEKAFTKRLNLPTSK